MEREREGEGEGEGEGKLCVLLLYAPLYNTQYEDSCLPIGREGGRNGGRKQCIENPRDEVFPVCRYMYYKVTHLHCLQVNALQSGMVLVIDEADKAPTHVTCVLKNILEGGEITLADGRRVVHSGEYECQCTL